MDSDFEIHHPVLVREVIELLNIKSGGIYIDGTAGLGGHSKEILKRVGESGRVLAIDKDEDALSIVLKKLNSPALMPLKGDFSDMKAIANGVGYREIDGIVLDLGLSMMQIRASERGFSFESEGRLDMRMDRNAELTAWDVVNRYHAVMIEQIIRDYGEEGRARSKRIAEAIVTERRRGGINTCRELSGLVVRIYGKRGKRHPATKTFQALRILVNDELSALDKALQSSASLLKRGGRLCVISYHSLEDRIVKTYLREKGKESVYNVLTKKPITPSKNELRENSSSRSAKLRGGERT